MFERFNEEARRSLFFARCKTTERNGDAIADEDLLHGISLAAPAAIELLGAPAADAFRSPESAEQFWARIERDSEAWLMHSRKEIPLSSATKRALQFATAEADSLLHQHIGPEHLLLGLLRDDPSDASRRLREAGVRLADIRVRLQERGKGAS